MCISPDLIAVQASTGLTLLCLGDCYVEIEVDVAALQCGIDIAQTRPMKHLLYALLVAAFAWTGVDAQNPDKFSGTWNMDLARSESAAQGQPIGPVTVAIRQTPSELWIETTKGGNTQAVRYVPVGSKSLESGESVGTFKLDGPRLVTNLAMHINKQAVTVEEIRSLDAHGTEMTVKVTLVVQHGYQSGVANPSKSAFAPNTATGTDVFRRVR
jgi:hypothetical protein